MKMTVRYTTQRFDQALLRGVDTLKHEGTKEFQDAADAAAERWGKKIAASGRGGSHNSQMADIQTQVTEPKSGGWFARMGWLSGAPQAEDGKTTWFVYQDTGYHMFGGDHFVQGLMLQMDARQDLINEMHDAAERISRKVEREIGRA